MGPPPPTPPPPSVEPAPFEAEEGREEEEEGGGLKVTRPTRTGPAKTRTDFLQRPAALIANVKNSKEKNYSEIQSELFIMTGNSSGLDPTPKRNHRAEVSGRILVDCHFLVDSTQKRIYL